MSRILLFTGKGGVGKTTIAAATAIRAAEQGCKTIIISTDSAHSLGDSLDCSLGPEPVPVSPNLWAQESNILYDIEKHWGTVKRWLAALMAWRGVSEIVAGEIAVFPGMEELASLFWVDYHERAQKYDAIVVDCAPSGESLRLLTFPEIMQWWLNKLLPAGRKMAPIAYPMVHRFTDMPLPDRQIFTTIESFFELLGRLRSLLSNPERTTVRLVVNAEKMVIKETQRTYAYLNLYGYAIDAIICNRLIPRDAEGSYWEGWKSIQEKHLQLIEECFSPLPIFKLPLLEREVVGMKALEQIGHLLYKEKSPTSFFFKGKPMNIERDSGGYTLSLNLPLMSKKDVSLTRSGDELIATIGNQRRSILLPQVLARCEIKGAKLDAGFLNIRFEEKPNSLSRNNKGKGL